MFHRRHKNKEIEKDAPILEPALKSAIRLKDLPVEMLEEEPLPDIIEMEVAEDVAVLPRGRFDWIPYRWQIVLQSMIVLAVFGAGSYAILDFVIGDEFARAGMGPTATSTLLPPLPTRTSVPTATPSPTVGPTPKPQGRGKSLADIYTSAYAGFDNRFGTMLMGSSPDFEEYLLCFDGTGIKRDRAGTELEQLWTDQPICIPGTFWSVTTVNNILITSDIVHALGISEEQWIQLSVHIYEHGAPDGFIIDCPAGVVADTSKFCLGSS